MIVVACNTVSAAALDIVEAVAGVPVVGMIEPAVRAAVELSPSKRIGVIGTRATIESQAYTLALYAHGGADDITVIEHACPLLVALAEEGWLAHPATYAIVEEYLQPLLEAQIDTLILGCTHFPLLANTIEQIAPVRLIDPGYWAARQVQRMLNMSLPDTLDPPAQHAWNTTSLIFPAILQRLLDSFSVSRSVNRMLLCSTTSYQHCPCSPCRFTNSNPA